MRNSVYHNFFLCLFPVVFAIVGAAPSFAADKKADQCSVKGITLKGKVKIVESFPDLKVQIVDSFPDIKVKQVDSFPDKCGKWQLVDSFPDFTIQYVASFPDVKVKFVDSFPGME